MKQMEIITVDKNEKYLRQISKPVDIKDIPTKEFQKFLDQLVFTTKVAKTFDGWQTAGLAAVQVGKPINVLVIRDFDDENIFNIYINPEYDVIGDKCGKGLEGCLSIPDVTGYVERPKKIKVKYIDRLGQKHKERLSGWNARIFLHEYDHLLGILFTDKLVENGNNS